MDYLSELYEATSRFADIIERTTGTEQVPSCPGWTVTDLAVHVGAVHRFAAATVLSGQLVSRPRPMVGPSLADWYRSAAAALVCALRAVDPDEPVANFAGIGETAKFWGRRQMHETLMHAVDACQALDISIEQVGITAEHAADGVDEVLTVYLPYMAKLGRPAKVSATLRVHARDTDDTWVLAPANSKSGVPSLVADEIEADAQIIGSSRDLYFALWHRGDISPLILEGQAASDFMAGHTTP